MPGRTVTAVLDANVSGYIAKMNSAAAATRDFATKSASAVGKNKQGITDLTRTAGLLGAGLGAGVAVAVKSFADFDSAISSVAATGQDAKANLGALRDAAIQAGAATKFSATEAAGGLESLLKAGVSSKDALGGGLKGALDLAAAGNLGVADSAEVAATAMTQFGLAGSQVPHIADLLAAGAGKAQGEVSDMAQALQQSGLVASQFGLSIEDTTGSLAAFANAGLIGSDAGTSFKTMLQRLSNPSAQAASTMKQLGINAYDAGGNFVGITNLADQLKNKLGPLSQAQRNAALATIFGSDAIRAANVLYTQGGSGIQTWINAVNQTGYAADVAATKMDNLKGDLEQLKGSFETALIGLGEGANGPLRSLVQDATSAVNAFNDLGSGTKGTILAVAGITAGTLLAAAGLGRLAVAAVETRTALASLNITAATSGAALGRLAAVAGPVAAALLAVEAAGQVLDTYGAKVGSLDAVTASLQALAGAQDQTAASAVSFSSAFPKPNAVNQIAVALGYDNTAITSLDAALQVSTAGGLRGYAVGFQGMLESIRPGKQALERARDGIAQVDQGLAQLVSSGHADQAAAAFQKISESSGVDPAKLATQFTAYQAALDGVGKAAGDAGSKAAGSSAAYDSAAAALAAMGTGAAGAAQSVDDLVKSLFSANNAALAASDAQIGYEAAVDAAAASAKKNGDNLKVSSAAGRENQTALNGLAAASQKYVQSLVEQGKGSKAIKAATADARSEFIQQATAMGLSSSKAKDLADKYGLIPKKVATEVDVNAKNSKADLAQINAAIKGLPKNQQVQIRSAYKSGGIEAAQAKLKELKDKTVTAGTKANTQGAVKAKQAMNQLDSRTVTAGTKSDTSGAKKTQAAVNGVKGKKVPVTVTADTSGASEARRAIATVNGKTVYVNVVRRGDRGNKDGGLLDSTFPGYAGGHVIHGAGGPREDNIALIDRKTKKQTAWGSVGEMVTNARSTANNYGPLSTINANPDKRYGLFELADGARIAGLASGGSIADGGLAASTGRYQSSDIYALIQALITPVQDIAAAAADVQREQAKIGKPLAAKNKAEKAYDRAKDRQEDLRDRVARLAKEAAATKGQTKADRDLAKARRALTAANNDVSKSSRAKTKAEQAYKDIAGPLEEATQRLTDAQKALADSAKGVSDSFSQQYRSSSTDAQDWIELMTTGASDLKNFNAEIVQLRKTGLNETLVQQIIAMGQVAGGEIANQIIAGGASLAGALNTANSNLQTAADNLGYTSATAPVRKFASGTPNAPQGLAWVGEQGPELVRFRGGEVVHTAAASRAIVDTSRRVVDNTYARSTYSGANPAVNIDLASVQGALAGMRISGTMQVSQDRGYLDGVVIEVLDRETAKIGTAF